MNDFESITAAYSLSSEPVIIARDERVVYMNPPAVSIARGNFCGINVGKLLGDAGSSALADSGYVTSCQIAGKNCTVRGEALLDCRIYFIHQDRGETLPVNDAMFSSMRSILMSMSATSNALLESGPVYNDPKLKDTATALRRAVMRFHRLTDNVNLAYLAKQNRIPCVPGKVRICEECRNYVRIINDIITTPKIELSFEKEIELNLDRRMIVTMLLNLLVNCAKHAKGCSVIRMSIRDCGARIIISMIDDGYGMSQNELDTAFRRYEAQYTLSQLNDGAGYGLTAAEGIARSHHGTLLLNSREGIGTAVFAVLPKDLPEKQFDEIKVTTAERVADVLVAFSDVLTNGQIEQTE